jgi:tripartite ATP-independent transporter DctM subunit
MMVASGILLLLALLALGMPVAAALGLVALTVVLFEAGAQAPFVAAQAMTNGVNSFVLIAAPFFMLAGEVMNQGGLTRRIYRLADSMVGWMPGGLGQVNIMGSTLFAGMTGSAVSDAVGLGTMEIKAMTDKGYDRYFAAAITSASSLIGPIIPPSVPMVIYGAITGASVGALFVAGIVPGVLMALSLMVAVYFYALRGHCPREPKPAVREVVSAALDALPSLAIPFIVIVGIFSGWFTPTEAAVVSCCYALALSAWYGELSVSELLRIIRRVLVSTGALFYIVAATAVLGFVVTRSGVMIEVALWLSSEIGSPTVLLLLIVGVYLLVGLFMEPVAAMLLLVPILLPAVKIVGIDVTHFGVVTVLALCVGLLTPPVGIILYVVARIADVKVERLSIAVLPFLAPIVLVLLATVIWPDIALGLPRLLFAWRLG